MDLYNDINRLSPFGEGNQEPTFKSTDVITSSLYVIKDRHIKFTANGVDSIAFNMMHKHEKISSGKIDMCYNLSKRGNKVNLIVRNIS